MTGAYAWEAAFGGDTVTFGLGTVRGVVSQDRQYLAVYSDAQPTSLCGRVSDWRSSESSLLALEVVLPDADLTEDDVPALLPAPMQKYLRYYTLSRAFGRPGEGRVAILAEHYDRRFQRGVAVFKRLTDVARQDHTYQREEAGPETFSPPRVRLPASYPAVWS